MKKVIYLIIALSCSLTIYSNDDAMANVIQKEANEVITWQEWLNSYENFIDKYIPIYKASLAGDAVDMQLLTEYMQDLLIFTEQSNKIQTDLTEVELLEYSTQFSIITMKLYQ